MRKEVEGNERKEETEREAKRREAYQSGPPVCLVDSQYGSIWQFSVKLYAADIKPAVTLH
jgi:hypothetical protein